MRIPAKYQETEDTILARMCHYFDLESSFCLAHLAEGRCLTCPVARGTWHIKGDIPVNQCQDWNLEG